MLNTTTLFMAIALLVSAQDKAPIDEQPATTPKAPALATYFELPCDGYREALRGKGNFGAYIDPKHSKTAFAGSYHLAEDVWVKGGEDVRCVANGRVVYSDFSPTWTDEAGGVHWNLGNVIVIEHELPPSEDKDPSSESEPSKLCSVYVHLGAKRQVKVGEIVSRGQRIGTVGAHRSEENGRYPQHLHFGLHRGPYLQISPSWKRELQRDARQAGLPCGPKGEYVKGEIQLTLLEGATVRVDFVDQPAKTWFSLLVGSTYPGHKPADIAGWCQGYGDEATVEEWLRPSEWIGERLAPE